MSFHPVNGRDSGQATFGRAPLKHSPSRSRSNKNRINLTDIDEEQIGVRRSPMPRDLGVQRNPMPRDIEELVRMSVFNEMKKQQQTRYSTINNTANIDLHLLHNKI